MFYKIHNSTLDKIGTKTILERDVQNLVEKKLDELFGLEFVDTEFSIENVRFDTLAFDRQNNTPVIIEFKKSYDKSLFDQGLEYLNILFSRKADFSITLHKKVGISPDPDKISWENARVIFVSGRFSERQKRAISFQGLPIDLWNFEWLENDFFKIEKESLTREAKLSEFSKSIGNGSMTIQKVQREIKEYDREYHEKIANPEVWELFEVIENEVPNWGDFEIRFKKQYIVFRSNGKGFLSVVFYKSRIKVYTLKEVQSLIPSNSSLKIRDVSNIGHYGFGTTEILISNKKDLTELFFILKKAYEIL